MDNVIRLAVGGATNAALYALIAFSLVLIYRGSGIKNFGVGFIAVVGGIFFARFGDGGGGWLVLALAVIISALVGAACYLMAIRPAERRGAKELNLAMSTFGFGLVLYFFAGILWPKTAATAPPLIDGTLDIAGVTLPIQRVLMVVIAAIVLLVVGLFLERTMAGWSLEAVAFSQPTAALYGVNVLGSMIVLWMMAGAVAGLAGALVAALSSITRDLALPLAVHGIAAAVLGGLGSLKGAVVGAIVVAAAEVIFVRYVSSAYAAAFTFLLLFIVLVVRPQGLFGLPRHVERT
jgi:branched-chain amino acid transport system permease protein